MKLKWNEREGDKQRGKYRKQGGCVTIDEWMWRKWNKVGGCGGVRGWATFLKTSAVADSSTSTRCSGNDGQNLIPFVAHSLSLTNCLAFIHNLSINQMQNNKSITINQFKQIKKQINQNLKIIINK